MKDIDFIVIVSNDGVVLNPAEQQAVWFGMHQLSKQNGERIPGKILMLLASEMNISPHQAKKLDTINRKASDSVKKAFEDGDLSTDAAFELSRTDEETQDEALKQLETEPSKTAKAVRSVI